jgi:TRAP-type C4-dicarboxylate transport system substrate-binding protein
MKKKCRIVSLSLLSIALFFILAGQAVSKEKYVIKVGNIAGTKQPITRAIEYMKFIVEGKSNGRIELQHFPAGQLGNFREMAEQVQLGTLELCFTTGGGIANFFPEIQAFEIPYLVPSQRVVEMMTNDREFINELKKDALAKTGSMRLLTISGGGGWRSFYTTKKQVKSVADLKDLKIRTVESPIQMQFVKSLGATPTPVPWQELYTSFASGIVVGTKNSISGIIDMNFDEYIKYGILDDHSFVWEFWWANDNWWKSLPPDIQGIMLEGLYEMKTVTDALTKLLSGEYIGDFEKGGGQIYFPSEEELDTFRAAQGPVIEWYTEKYGDRWVRLIQEAVARAEALIDELDEDSVK